MQARSLRYVLVDVFAESRFAGNQLAVVLGADALSTYQMQTIAAEFNLAETTFPMELTEQDEAVGADYRVRIFTASREIPFAGHPTLGTAWVLARQGLLGAGARLQACGAGLVGVDVPAADTEPLELRSKPRDLSAALSGPAATECARSVGLDPADLAGPAFVAGCGLSFVHLPVLVASLARARPRLAEMRDVDLGDFALQDPLIGLNVYAVLPGAEDATDLMVRSRVFVPGPSVPEDPATGSAAVGLGMALVASGLAEPEGTTRYDIAQGVELGRPSRLWGRVSAEAGSAVTCWVAGRVQPIGEGAIAVPDVS
ncbi:MAG: PhzF family phenazine biosynthesis protein [Nocardioidaceae bacterium]